MELNHVKKVQTNEKLNINKVNPPSELTRDYRLNVVFIDLDSLEPYEHQARKLFEEEDLEELSNSIRTHGIRTPLTVIRAKDDKYQIVSGERRWRAARKIGLKAAPCILNENLEASQEIALVENIQRKDLYPIELLEGIEAYLTNHPSISRDEARGRLGLSRTRFFKILSIGSLCQEARNIALQHQVGFDKLVAIAKAAPEKQVVLLNKSFDNQSNDNSSITLKESYERAMSKKHKVLQIKIKNDQFENEDNFYILSEKSKKTLALILKNLVQRLEESDD